MIKSTTLAAAAVAVVAIAAGGYYLARPAEIPASQDSQVALAEDDFVMPELSPEAAEGERYFNAVCAACHGINALGTEQGPPFIHDTYNPGHHDDGAFFRAAQNGVPQHHWPYGNMPPQKVTRAEVARIVAYVRELQVANGIDYFRHDM